jgi:hypothetical protein
MDAAAARKKRIKMPRSARASRPYAAFMRSASDSPRQRMARADRTHMTTTNATGSEPRSPRTPTVARLRARKDMRRKRELALLALALAFVAAAIFFDEPALILVSVFPALASYGQR